MKGLPILVIALLLGGCGADPVPSVPAAGNVFQVSLADPTIARKPITASVIDDVGLVLGAAKVAGAGGMGPDSATAVAFPADSGLRVSWIGGVCNSPTIALSGSTQNLSVTLRPEGDPALVQGCIDLGVYYAVDISLAAPVEQAATHLQVVR